MDKNLRILNIVYAVADTVIAALVVVGLGLLSYHFGKWWVILFSYLPLAFYFQHTLIIDADLQQAEVDALNPKNAAKTQDDGGD